MRFFHSYSALDIQGVKAEAQLQAEADIIFRHNLAGRTVLDIGAWDGWFSFRAEQLGAAEVTASDWFCWNGPGWGKKECFDHVHEKLGSGVKTLECDIPDLLPEKHGTYDVVLLLGVIYHVKDMLSILDKAQAMSKDQLVIETVTMTGGRPVARYWKNNSLSNDPTNFWTPTVSCVKDMLSEFGFQRFEVYATPYKPQNTLKAFIKSRHWIVRLLNILGYRKLTTRHIIHAWRSEKAE